MKLIYDRSTEYELVWQKRPDFLDDQYKERFSGSSAVISLAQEILEEVCLFKLSIRDKDCNCLEKQVGSKRYFEAEVLQRLYHSRRLFTWANLLRKKGYKQEEGKILL